MSFPLASSDMSFEDNKLLLLECVVSLIAFPFISFLVQYDGLVLIYKIFKV